MGDLYTARVWFHTRDDEPDWEMREHDDFLLLLAAMNHITVENGVRMVAQEGAQPAGWLMYDLLRGGTVVGQALIYNVRMFENTRAFVSASA